MTGFFSSLLNHRPDSPCPPILLCIDIVDTKTQITYTHSCEAFLLRPPIESLVSVGFTLNLKEVCALRRQVGGAHEK